MLMKFRTAELILIGLEYQGETVLIKEFGIFDQGRKLVFITKKRNFDSVTAAPKAAQVKRRIRREETVPGILAGAE